MKKAKLVFLQVFPSLVILVVLILAGFLTYYFAPKIHVNSDVKSFSAVEEESIALPQLQEVHPEVYPNVVASPIPSDKPKVKVVASLKAVPTATPNSMTLIASPGPYLSSSSSPSPTAIPSTSPSSEAGLKVNIEIKTPDSSSNFSVETREGMNVCDVMQKAKDEGKIQSITFDDTYLSTFKSKYILEINGMKNNWTFKVNGDSPLGCSLSIPKPNDSIVWTFG